VPLGEKSVRMLLGKRPWFAAMCCRYLLLRAHLNEMLERLGVRAMSEHRSRYNISPGTKIPVILNSAVRDKDLVFLGG